MRSRVVSGHLLAAAAAALVVIGCALSGGAGLRRASGVAGSATATARAADQSGRASASRHLRSAAGMSQRAFTAVDAGCILFTDRAATATSQECLACHESGTGGATALRRCHPVELAYAPSTDTRFRSVDEVIRRGVFLPDGKLRCVTCHDGASPWEFALALPPGATATPAVDPRDPRTYDPAYERAAPQPGDRVSPRPLCLVCHAFD